MPNEVSEIRRTLHEIGERNIHRAGMYGTTKWTQDVDVLLSICETLTTFAEQVARRQVRHPVAAARHALGLDPRNGGPAPNIWAEALADWPTGIRFDFQAEDVATAGLIVAALTELNPEAPLPAAVGNYVSLDRQHVATLAEHVGDTTTGASGGTFAAAGVTLTTVEQGATE